MNQSHPLLERAQKYPLSDHDLTPAGCEYDPLVGAWREIDTGRLWVDTPNRKEPRTKKEDLETGEDQKGE